MFLASKADSLYLGKLAVKEGMRGQGICRTLVEHSAIRAADLGLSALELETTACFQGLGLQS
nr:GNAT family N-acetyltransferase [uncultured Ruegeria sp.]